MTDIVIEALEDFIAKHPSQSAAARSLGVTPSFIGQVKRGHRPLPETMYPMLGLVKTLTRKKHV